MKYANHYSYISKVRLILLGSGTQGISQHDLNQKTRTKIFQTEHLLDLLEEWEKRQWVQKFRVRGHTGHAKMTWRATTKLRDDWSSLEIDGELPTQASPGQTLDQD